ncbi:MAG: hypothetical protein H7308_17200 [Chthonomonadaceae bacterium]|nr:hypothetical protein [Chthonomonadaceae bacterium]
MATLMESALEYLEDNSIHYQKVEGKDVLHLGFELENFYANCVLFVDEEQRYLGFSSVCGLRIPQDKRTEISEFIARANYGLGIGAFQMNFDNGEILYKTGIYARDSEIESNLLDAIVCANTQTHDRYYPGLIDVLFRDIAPSDAIETIESNRESSVSEDEVDAWFEKLVADMEEPSLEEIKPSLEAAPPTAEGENGQKPKKRGRPRKNKADDEKK